MTDWLNERSLIDWLIGRLTDWLMTDWLNDWLFDWMADDLLTDWLTDWLWKTEVFVGLYQCLLSMLSPNLVFLPNSLFIEKQRMVYCMSGWVSTVKCPCQNMLKQTFLQLMHDMGSSKIVSCGLFNQWRQWLSTFWLNGWFASSLITGNVMSEFCETSPSFPINNVYIMIKIFKI